MAFGQDDFFASTPASRYQRAQGNHFTADSMETQQREQLNQGGGGGSGGGAIGVLVLIAPALAAPAMLVLLTWGYFRQTQHWEWPILLTICIAEVAIMIWLVVLFFQLTPVILTSITTALYLGFSYGAFTQDWGYSRAALIGVATGALGYLMGRAAPNKWMSHLLIATPVAIGAGLSLILYAFPPLRAEGYVWIAFALRWAAAGLILGAVLRIVFLSQWVVLAAGVGVIWTLWKMPYLVERYAVDALALGLSPHIG